MYYLILRHNRRIHYGSPRFARDDGYYRLTDCHLDCSVAKWRDIFLLFILRSLDKRTDNPRASKITNYFGLTILLL